MKNDEPEQDTGEDLKDISVSEKKGLFSEIMATPKMQEMQEGIAERVYVAFTERYRTGSPEKLDSITFGPYQAVDISPDHSGKELMTNFAGDLEEGSQVCLATHAGDGWRLSDGLEETGRRYWARFHTYKAKLLGPKKEQTPDGPIS